MSAAGDGGFDGLAIDGGCTLAALPGLAAEALRGRTPLVALFAPIPPVPLRPGKRLPRLAAPDDKEERLAALKATEEAFETARTFGITRVALDIGPVRLAVRSAEIRRRFARAEIDEGEPGAKLLARLREERKARAGTLYDAARAALERLLLVAERLDLRVSLVVARGPWDVPSPREAQQLLREFAGAPLGLVAAPARRAALEALGMAGPVERWPELERNAGLVWATDACGLELDLLPGLGELGTKSLACPPETPIVVSGRPDSSRAELRRARTLVAGWITKETPRAPSAASLSPT